MPHIERCKRVSSAFCEWAVSFGKHPITGHPGNQTAAILTAEHGWPHREPASSGDGCLQLLRCPGEPMQNGSVAAAVLPQSNDDGLRRAATMDAEDAPPVLT